MAPGDRRNLLWLMAAQAVVIVPRLDVLPWWAFPFWLAIAAWYWQIARGRRAYPSTWIKVFLAAVAVTAVYLQFKRLVHLEAMLTVLVCALSLKLLELKSSRDHWLLLLLCYFLVACGFLFSQQITAVLLAMCQLTCVLIAQQVLHRQRYQPRAMLKLTGVMAMQSLPLMLALFVIFPRIGPLWSMPVPGRDARTGMSDSLEFGDVARLSRSGELAFRVSFDGAVPEQENLYWRGLVLERFDGNRWSRAPWRHRMEQPLSVKPRYRYTVTLEPGFHEWLYTLPVAEISRDDIRHRSTYTWVPRRPLSGRLSYRAISDPGLAMPEPRPETLNRNLELPGGGNPRARALAARWRELEDVQARVEAARRFFLDGAFTYTLSPGLLGEDNVDGFLFDSQRGFCEHFAGSFAFLMRAAGIPARLVVGYQGGEYNRRDDYLLVHQSDAHAWVEVWLAEQGWQRIDPTALVAPSRIRAGAEAVLREQGSYLEDAPLSLRRFAWATRLRYFLDSINYSWARWVLNYDEQRQWQLLGKLLGEVSPLRLVVMVMIAGGIPLLGLFLSGLRLPGQSAREPASRAYLQCCRVLARRGVARESGETPLDYLERISVQAPKFEPWLHAVTDDYIRCAYDVNRDDDSERALQRLKRARWMLRKTVR